MRSFISTRATVTSRSSPSGGCLHILVNKATGWVADSFAAADADRLGALQPVSAATWQQQFTVDAVAAALLIAELAGRHIARGANWGRIIGLTSGGEIGFPEEVSYGAAKAAQVTTPCPPPWSWHRTGSPST